MRNPEIHRDKEDFKKSQPKAMTSIHETTIKLGIVIKVRTAACGVADRDSSMHRFLPTVPIKPSKAITFEAIDQLMRCS
jgi:hypothetical protein